MGNERRRNEIVYEAEVIICNSRTVAFHRAAAQGIECFNKISKNQYVLNDHFDENGDLTFETLACPIRVFSIGQLRNTGDDWCKYGSPIDELYYENIPRWWPKDWLYNQDGSLPKTLEFKFAGENIGKLDGRTLIVRCKVIKYDRSMSESFGDIHIEGLDDIEYRPESINLVDDMIVDDININHIEDVEFNSDTTIKTEEDEDMFGKKKEEPVVTNEVVEEKVDVVVEKPVVEQPVKVETTEPVVEETKPAKSKTTDFKKPLLIGVGITGFVAAAALFYVKVIKK